MNKLIQLLYVNILAMFDINKIKVARESNVKSNLESRMIILAIVAIFYGYLIYKFLTLYEIANKYYILCIGFILSSILCFFLDLFLIEPLVFKNKENDLIFSLPLSKYQILFSKLFNVYLQNLIYIAVIMFSVLMAFLYYVNNVSEEFVLMYIISSLFIPFVPIVLATILSYFNAYLKVKINNKLIFNGLRIILIGIVLGICYGLFKNIEFKSVDNLIALVIKQFNVIYPLGFCFYKMISLNNVLFFLLIMIVSIMVLYIYSILLSNNYLKLCSMLKGVKKNVDFKYKKTFNLHKVLGIVRKELINIFNNTFYFFNTYGLMILVTIIMLVVIKIFNVDKWEELKHFSEYFNLYCPTLLAMCVTFNTSTIVAMSIEKDNMQILRAMPLSMKTILFSKWLTNVLIGSIFIVINALIVGWGFKEGMNLFGFNILVPFSALMLVSLTGLVLDYRFINKNVTDDNTIIKQRLITIFPSFMSLVIGIGPMFMPVSTNYKFILGSYVLFFLIIMIGEIIYLVINHKKLLRGLFN